jgi:methionine salvage enolase-phosphatase E1
LYYVKKREEKLLQKEMTKEIINCLNDEKDGIVKEKSGKRTLAKRKKWVEENSKTVTIKQFFDKVGL